MNVLFLTAECSPFAMAGGLGDVAGSLPAALNKNGADVRVVMPLYGDIPSRLLEEKRFIKSFAVSLNWNDIYCGLFELKKDGVTYYFLDNEYYFKRKGIYGHYDDAERYAFFSCAAIELISHIDFKPDLLHVNDWHTALAPLYLKYRYTQYSDIRSLLTIHNIGYQGKFGHDLLHRIFGLPEQCRNILEWEDCLNVLKGGIETADMVNTVSPTYANELLDPAYAYGLHDLLNWRRQKLVGILNGIDTRSYDPETDPNILKNYSAKDISGKKENKAALQKALGLAEDPDKPLVGVIMRLVEHKGADLIASKIYDILNRGAQVVILGKGDWNFENYFGRVQDERPDDMRAIIDFNRIYASRVYAASDVFLLPSRSEPCGLGQMIALRYGAIPVVRETGGLRDSVFDIGTNDNGNGFTFYNYSDGDFIYAVNRALDAYYDEKLWPSLVKRAMLCDYGWSKSAMEYLNLYKKITGR